MGFRLRKSIKVMPGVKVNLSKSGLSTSVGGRGGTFNVGKRGVRATASIPGTGVSYSQQLSNGTQKAKRGGCGCLSVIALLFVVSGFAGAVSTMLT